MNLSNHYRREITLLAESFFEGTLDETQAERLDQLVSQDPLAAKFYMEYVETHAELYHTHKGQAPPPPNDLLVNDILGDDSIDPLCRGDKSEASSNMGLNGFTLGGLIFSWGGLGVATLLSLLSLAVIVWWNSVPTDQTTERLVATKQVAKENSVAKLTAVSDCDWRSDVTAAIEVGASLEIGDCLALDRGSIEVTYDTGATVCVKGPATYAISNVNRGLLEEGEVNVYVPTEAIGFMVDTPAGQVIDQGTEFDLKVKKGCNGVAATADVQVIQGAVDIAIPKNVRDEAVRQRFESGESVRLSSMQQVRPATRGTKLNDPYDPRKNENLRLWLRANAAVMQDKHGCVTEMIDLVGGSNKEAENFRQSKESKRPRWVDRGLNGHATLTFSGHQYLQLASPKDLCFKDESLTIFVVGKASDHTQYFISSKGTEDESVTKGFRFTTSRSCGLRYMAGKSVNVSRACPIARHNVLSVVHDRRQPGKNSVALFCNGRQLGEVEPVVDSELENTYPVMIGANPEAIRIAPEIQQNYLNGDIAEILVYGRVLTELEQQRIESYLMIQYGIKAVPLESR